MKWPGATDRVLLACAICAGVGAALTSGGWSAFVLVGLVVGMVMPARRAVRAALVVGLGLGFVSATASVAADEAVLATSLPSGPIELDVRLLADPMVGRYGWAVRGDAPDLVPILLTGDQPTEAVAFDVVRVTGLLRSAPGTLRGRPYAARLAVDDLSVVETSLWFAPANRIRSRVQGAVAGWESPGAALVSGFLIGDIEHLPDVQREQLTASGLSHFVAVSGSNVALFLALWWVVTAPLALSPRTRAMTGVAGVALFVMVTRWEPSVLRAGVMVGALLVGRAVGVPLTAWGSLAVAVVGLVVADAWIVQEVGFQLSAAATAGLLVGSGLFAGRGPGWLTAPLGATVSAQVAVAPFLLVHFGSVPLFSPLANLIAGPLVALSTTIGGIGALVGAVPLVRIAVGLAAMVVEIAAVSSRLPVVGWFGFLGIVALAVGVAWPRTRVPAIAVAVVVMVLFLVQVTGQPPPSMVALDVGQGDAVLLTGGAGERILIDGGPDPRVLARKLTRLGVHRLDLLIVTHPHADHVGGLTAVIGAIEVGEVWWAPVADAGAMGEVLDMIDHHGVPLREPKAGERFTVGSVGIEVLGPVRRYVGLNDASLVVVAEVNGWRVSLSGDIETYAQADLGPIEADVLKVPHHGGGTSSAGWLRASAGAVAVVSVGQNDYGHPAPWVIEVLETAGAQVCRTDRDGDVEVILDQASGSLSGC